LPESGRGWFDYAAGSRYYQRLHIAPAYDHDFRRVTSPVLENLGESAASVWKKLVKDEGRFISVATEQLFGNLSAQHMPEMES